MECIILSVNDTYMDAQEVMHMTDYSKITALYSRLSVGDEDRDGGESNSIQNQKIFLENYARGQHLTNIRHYIDDDESGRFFDRSAYSRMMDDVENGKIGVCIMKDLTRWGRDYLQVGNAMEIFRRNNVRFIAVNNGIDSEKPDTLEFAPFINIMSEWYAKDISKKVKTGIKTKGMSGKPIVTEAPYGYVKDPDNKDFWIIDEEAAAVVRLIFRLFIGGKNRNQIAVHLKNEHMSRFGRNYLQVGFYTEMMFPKKNVRFIAVNNGVDSANPADNDFTPFLNIMNEWYAKDTSKKIKAVFKAKMRDGKRVSGAVPYGYYRKPEDKQTLYVDEASASVVRRIFQLACDGMGATAIADTLSEDKILIPSAYARQNHPEDCQCTNYHDPYTWNATTVGYILNRREYLGHTVLGKTTRDNFKTKRKRIANEDELLVFYNTHEAIIDQETYVPNRIRHWKNLALNFRSRMRKRESTITGRWFLMKSAENYLSASVRIMD